MYAVQITEVFFFSYHVLISRSQWLRRGLRLELSSAARILGSWVLTSLEA
jgi:hypothetical protein